MEKYIMKEFLMVEFFKSSAMVCKYITTRKIPKRKILSLVYKGDKYVLFYYTTIRKEEKCNRVKPNK
jgi:hypothetical protein